MITSKKLTAERLAEIKAFKNKTLEDCPVMTQEELDNLHFVNKKYFDVYTVPKRKPVTLQMDLDILDAFKKLGKGYQNKINKALRIFVTQEDLESL